MSAVSAEFTSFIASAKAPFLSNFAIHEALGSFGYRLAQFIAKS